MLAMAKLSHFDPWRSFWYWTRIWICSLALLVLLVVVFYVLSEVLGIDDFDRSLASGIIVVVWLPFLAFAMMWLAAVRGAFARCPRCQQPFAHRHMITVPLIRKCMHCGFSLDEVTPTTDMDRTTSDTK
jgi:hypothetical protein